MKCVRHSASAACVSFFEFAAPAIVLQWVAVVSLSVFLQSKVSAAPEPRGDRWLQQPTQSVARVSWLSARHRSEARPVGGVPVSRSRLPELTEIHVQSSVDNLMQPVRFWAPQDAERRSTVLFVFLHSWSSDYRQDNSKWLQVAVRNGWIFLHPNFRGANQSPQACGSRVARQDILDAIRWACGRFQVDRARIYLCGVSGGGHMSMLMAGHHPDCFSAVSAWVGIVDLAEWYRFHSRSGKPEKYARMILQCLGGPPGSSPQIDREYRDRSPRFHLSRVGDLPIDIFAGVNDGHSGSVPVWHSLTAFNVIAKAHGDQPVSEDEIRQLSNLRRLRHPRDSDTGKDPLLQRELRLRRVSGKARVTIFEGGHESVPAAAEGWLKQQRRMTSWP